MQILKLQLSQVTIPSYRQRREIDGEKLAELINSIEKSGLLQPIVVRDGGVLVAGERRLRAISNLEGLGAGIKFGGELWEPGFIPGVDIGTLDPLAAAEAELEENVCRVDLSLQERISATGRLADLRREQAKLLGRALPTVGEIALEVRGSNVGASNENTRRELILSQHLDNPEVAKAKTLDEAWKAHTRAETAERDKAHAQRVGSTYDKGRLRLIQADCTKWMIEQAGDQFDVIVTDPPYGINAQDFGDADGRLQAQTHTYDDSPEAWRKLMGICAEQWYRLAKPQAHLYVCCDIDRFVELKHILDDEGWDCHRTPIVNYKRDGARVPWISWGPQRKYELILYAMKGRKLVTRIYPDVIETLGDDNLGHGAQKPVALYSNLLQRSCKAGDKVLDTFCGTGTVFAAAFALKLEAVGVEADERYYGVAAKRIEELK